MFRKGSAAVVAAGLVLAVGGCGGADGTDAASDKGPAGGTAAPRPSGKLVGWVGSLCESAATLENLRSDSAKELKQIRNPDEDVPSVELLAVGYLSRTPDTVEAVDRDLKELDRSGVPAADRLLAAWQKKLEAVLPELVDVSPADGMADAEGSAAGVDKLVQSLTPPDPDLPALTKKDPRLAAAHKQAKQCAPDWKPREPGAPGENTGSPAPEATGPLPKAADGKNTAACSDGVCEILVTSTADITANGMNVHVTVSEESVTFQTAGTVMQLGGAGGEAGFGDELKAVVVAHNEDGAVLKFSRP